MVGNYVGARDETRDAVGTRKVIDHSFDFRLRVAAAQWRRMAVAPRARLLTRRWRRRVAVVAMTAARGCGFSRAWVLTHAPRWRRPLQQRRRRRPCVCMRECMPMVHMRAPRRRMENDKDGEDHDGGGGQRAGCRRRGGNRDGRDESNNDGDSGLRAKAVVVAAAADARAVCHAEARAQLTTRRRRAAMAAGTTAANSATAPLRAGRRRGTRAMATVSRVVTANIINRAETAHSRKSIRGGAAPEGCS